MIGTAIGVAAGHILLPTIIYNSYKERILLAPIELHFYPFKTLLAIVLGLLSTVLPAFMVAKRELGEKPAQLLLPKPPTSGSKILMERITPLWNRMSFTQKVTARNIFRYKQRMFMTILVSAVPSHFSSLDSVFVLLSETLTHANSLTSFVMI